TAAMRHMKDTGSSFWQHPIKLPMLKPISKEEHEHRWVQGAALVQKGDLIFTFDTQSLISRVITYFDQGAWSHTGSYTGDGHIIEAIGEGVVERNIEAYHSPKYRMGIYRF